MFANLPDILLRYRIIVGILALIVSAVTWTVDLTGLVYECPFCRSQRTVIGLLGVLLILPWHSHWFTRYIAACIAAFGIVNASMQHFRGWARIMAGEFEWGEQWYVNSWVLSGCALFIIMALVMLIWRNPPAPAEVDDSAE